MDPQGTRPLAKADTVLLLDSSAADAWVDLSQYDTDLTEDDAPYEDPSVRGAITGATGRELYVRATVEPTDVNGMLLIHADPANSANNTYAILLNGSGDLEFRQGGTLLTTMAVVIAVDSEISVHWSTRANPDTTGASDALISEMIAYNHQAGAYIDIVQVTHAVPTTNVAWALTVCGYWNGVATTLFQTPVIKARIGKAWHNSTEFAEDWVAARSAHGSTLPDVLEPLPITTDSGVADESEWTGQANVGYCAASADGNRGRMVTNLVNEVYYEQNTLDTTPTPTQWFIAPPGGSTVYKMDATKLRWLPHPGIRMAWVRVHVQSWVTAGAAVPIGVRCYAMNRPHIGLGPLVEGDPTPALDFDFVQATLTADHTSTGVGVWIELGLLRIPRFEGKSPSWVGTTTLCLAHAFDPGGTSANDANARLKIKAWHVRPVIGV
jgi:hypothetical protein